MKYLLPLAVVLLAWGALPSRLMALDQRTIAERTDRLKNMSEVERDRLNRNLQEFQKLSESDKQRYRDLHAQLLEDGAKSGGLTLVLKTYFLWLQTLTPSQRDELAKETTPSQKMVLVRQFKEAKDHLSESTEHQEPHETHNADGNQNAHLGEQFPALHPVFKEYIPLSPKDLKAVMKVLVDRLPADPPKTEFNDPKLATYIPIIHASVHASGGNYKEWPDEATLTQMISAMSKDAPSPVTRLSENKRNTVIRLMLLGILKQAADSIPKPTSDEKSAILESLNPDEKSRILEQPRQRMEWILTQRYLLMKGSDVMKLYKEIPHLRDQLIELFNRFEIPVPPRLEHAKLTPRPGTRQ